MYRENGMDTAGVDAHGKKKKRRKKFDPKGSR